MIAAVISEVAALAATLEDSPIAFKYPQANEGIEAMQQAASAFAAARDNAAKLDAALWVGEAYLLFSSALPDTGHGEHQTAWATARQIAQLLGGPVHDLNQRLQRLIREAQEWHLRNP